MPTLGDIMRQQFGIKPKYNTGSINNKKTKRYFEKIKNTGRKYLSKQEVIEKYHKNCEQIEPDYSRKINAEYLDLLAGYMTEDASFLQENELQINKPDFGKNILLMGIVGSGKSFLMRNISKIRNVKNPISGRFINENELLENEETAFEFKNYKGLIIDDLATNYDGLKPRFMRSLAEIRHEKWQKLRYQTHYTTNKNLDKIEQIYGIRLRDRLIENCNIIALDAEKSLRK